MSGARRAALFDLDGTLVDSAPDLAGAANDMRAVRDLPPLPYERLRRMVGSGARGMLGVALGIGPAHPDFAALRDEFLDRYEARLTAETRVFEGVEALLAALREQGIACGIVTNKATRFAAPLVAALGLDALTRVLVCGDTTPHSKPHPAPLLEAARRLGIAPEACCYVGDDLRDVQAGRAAGMRTVVAAWGYLGDGEPIEAWGADGVIECPADLEDALRSS
ncbi:phosphoglycolate phosphatase [Piscinibacter koreensis]|uniref:Phosphoglycolate phosphatase n=1 Tax=Piscinibacter koreensis TaxID=2742824 RepID=A0A7Y6NPV1_9BURK|nr:phosphoglycolate phosphatase [Schlegelella koreensis]NUZ07091.1 phosphoglycolate phosphatase [Schlegelella koreensis]